MRQLWPNLLMASGLGLVTRETVPQLEAWDFQYPPSASPEKREMLEMELLIGYAYIRKPP